MPRTPLAAIATLSLLLSACAGAESPHEAAVSAVPAHPAVTAAVTAADATTALPLLTVHKHPSCGCCGVWIEHMRQAGFPVEEKNTEDMEPVKAAAGVPYAMGSCHTAQVAGYFVEGHVPAEDVIRLLRERPQAKGLALPGMPVGSPGMEHPDGFVQPYTVSLVLADGSMREFSRHPRD